MTFKLPEHTATKQETQQFSCFHVSSEDFNKLAALPVKTQIYTEAQLKQAVRDALEAAAAEFDTWDKYYSAAYTDHLRFMKDEI